MSLIDDVLALPIGAEFTHKGRRFRRAGGCVSHYGPLSERGQCTTLYAWNDKNDVVLVTLRECSKCGKDNPSALTKQGKEAGQCLWCDEFRGRSSAKTAAQKAAE